MRTRTILDAHDAYGQLVAGNDRAAALSFLGVKDTALENEALFGREFVKIIRELLAISYLRAAEGRAAASPQDGDACTLLLSGAGRFAERDWVRAAIAEYLEILRDDPSDLTSRWLLNLAYMSAGDYPGGVPREYLMPPHIFKSEYEVGRFRDVAPALGLDVLGRGGGAILEDFDGDGYIDVMVSSVGLREQLRYFRNNADGSFVERTEGAGLKGITGGLNITSADFNNDGHVDVFVPRGAWLGPAGHHPPSLLRNNGDGTFADVTREAGVLTLSPGHTAAWADYDGDGWLDLFLGAETIPGYGETNPCLLFRNRGDGTFTEVAAEVGLGVTGWVKGAAWGDYDNDGRPDLYVSRLFETNLLFHNDGPGPDGRWRFSDATARAGVAEPLASFPCWFVDYDNDGWLDLFVSSCPDEDFSHVAGQVAADYLGLPTRAETPRLYRNQRDGTFADVTRAVRLDRPIYTMGANFGDIDNDGWSDFYLGTGNPMFLALMPNRMFRNAEGRRFQDVTTAAGLGHLQKGHGIAFGDVDNDGDQDVLAVFGGVYEGDTHRRVLYENPGSANRWLTLRLEGVRSNRHGVGARIGVHVRTAGGTRVVRALAGTGGSFGSSTLQQEIGLGRAVAVERVEIAWPSGLRQTVGGLGLDSVVRVREGDARASVVRLRRLRFAPGGRARLGVAARGFKQSRRRKGSAR